MQISLLPNRIAQRKKRIKHKLIEERVSGAGGVFYRQQTVVRPNSRTDQHPHRNEHDRARPRPFGSDKIWNLSRRNNSAQFVECSRAKSDRNSADQNQPDDRISFPNRGQDRAAIVIDQSEDPVIKLTAVLRKICDVRDEHDRAET